MSRLIPRISIIRRCCRGIALSTIIVVDSASVLSLVGTAGGISGHAGVAGAEGIAREVTLHAVKRADLKFLKG